MILHLKIFHTNCCQKMKYEPKYFIQNITSFVLYSKLKSIHIFVLVLWNHQFLVKKFPKLDISLALYSAEVVEIYDKLSWAKPNPERLSLAAALFNLGLSEVKIIIYNSKDFSLLSFFLFMSSSSKSIFNFLFSWVGWGLRWTTFE